MRPTHYRSCRQSDLEGLRPFVEHERHLDSRNNPLATSKIPQSIPARDASTYLYRPVALLSGGRPGRNTRRLTDATTPSARYAASGPIQLSSWSSSGKRLPSGRFVGYSSIYLRTCSCGLWPVSHSRSAPHLHQPASAAAAERRCGYRRYRGRLCRPFQVSGTYLPKLQSVQVRDQFTGVASMKLSCGLHRI